MTRLRKMMLKELQRRNYYENTVRHYIRTVEEFARHFHCSPDRFSAPAFEKLAALDSYKLLFRHVG